MEIINKQKPPFYQKFALVLLSIVIILAIVYIGNTIILPFLLALLFALLLRPVVIFLNKKVRIPHVLAVMFAVILFVLLALSIITFISWQISTFANDWVTIKQNMNANYNNLRYWIKDTFNISYTKQATYIATVKENSLKDNSSVVKNTLSSFSSTILNFVLIPIYTFLILLYHNLFKKFLGKLVAEKDHLMLVDILSEIKLVVNSYIVGLLLELGIVAILTSVGFMLIGVPYAILLGTITAVLNLIPYIGILCAGVISILVALTHSTEVSMTIGIVIVNSAVQLFDNNFIMPKIVASKVKINALVSIVSVFVGGALGGILGMFLALPITAMLKVIFDRIEDLKPWGYLLGDELPKTYNWGVLKLPVLSAGNDDENASSKSKGKEESKS